MNTTLRVLEMKTQMFNSTIASKMRSILIRRIRPVIFCISSLWKLSQGTYLWRENKEEIQITKICLQFLFRVIIIISLQQRDSRFLNNFTSTSRPHHPRPHSHWSLLTVMRLLPFMFLAAMVSYFHPRRKLLEAFRVRAFVETVLHFVSWVSSAEVPLHLFIRLYFRVKFRSWYLDISFANRILV